MLPFTRVADRLRRGQEEGSRGSQLVQTTEFEICDPVMTPGRRSRRLSRSDSGQNPCARAVDVRGIRWRADVWSHQEAPSTAEASKVRMDLRLVSSLEVTTMAFDRISIDHEKMGGLPYIRDLRIPVSTTLGQLAAGREAREILEEFPNPEPDDIRAALEYAAAAVQERELPLAAR